MPMFTQLPIQMPPRAPDQCPRIEDAEELYPLVNWGDESLWWASFEEPQFPNIDALIFTIEEIAAMGPAVVIVQPQEPP
jgi:hypothetical protein